MVMKEGILSATFKSFKFSFHFQWIVNVYLVQYFLYEHQHSLIYNSIPLWINFLLLYIYTLYWTVRRDEQSRSSHCSPNPHPLLASIDQSRGSTPSSNCSAPSFDFLDKRSPGSQQRTYLNNIPLTVINKLKYLIETLKKLFVWQQGSVRLKKKMKTIPELMMCPSISRMHFKYQERFILIPLIILMRDQSHYLLEYVSGQWDLLSTIFSENQSTEFSEQVLQYSQNWLTPVLLEL